MSGFHLYYVYMGDRELGFKKTGLFRDEIPLDPLYLSF
ncbi:hypothetical protein bcere0022_39490 [Bacillus cereus Rock3-44]|nr:hypothetical protein bcere0022_39490 [Bacillus cereus Rock3-44]